MIKTINNKVTTQTRTVLVSYPSFNNTAPNGMMANNGKKLKKEVTDFPNT
jgi:hypothetical protein